MKPVGVLDDTIGIGISWLSIVHCLAIPGIKFLMPDVVIHWNNSIQTHILLASFVIFFGIAAITHDQLQNCNLSVRFKMVPGLMMVMAATIAVMVLGPESWEVVMLTVGNLLIIWAHAQNRKLIYAYNSLACVASESTSSQTEQHHI